LVGIANRKLLLTEVINPTAAHSCCWSEHVLIHDGKEVFEIDAGQPLGLVHGACWDEDPSALAHFGVRLDDNAPFAVFVVGGDIVRGGAPDLWELDRYPLFVSEDGVNDAILPPIILLAEPEPQGLRLITAELSDELLRLRCLCGVVAGV